MDLTRGLQLLTSAEQKAQDVPGGPMVFADSSVPSRRLAQKEARKHLGVYGGADAIDWVADCVWLIAETAGNAEFHFEGPRGRRFVMDPNPTETKDEAVAAPADLARLLRRPNPWITWSDHFALTAIDYLLVGNAYWLEQRAEDSNGAPSKPLAYYRLRPDRVTVVPGASVPVARYEYKVDGAAKPLTFRPDQIVHFKRPNPHSDQFGLGVVATGARPLDVELALVDSQATFFEQGTRLSGVLETDRSLPSQIVAKLRKQFSDLYSGARNSYKVAMLERGLKFRAVQSNAQEAEYQALGRGSRDRIASMFRVPLPLLGDVESADRLAVKEAQRIFDNNTMQPFLNRLAETLSDRVVSEWGLKWVFDHKYQLPLEDQLELAEGFAALPGVRVREVRERVGLAPLGDERDELVLNLPGENDNDSKIKDRNLGREPGRPPKGENTQVFPDARVRA